MVNMKNMSPCIAAVGDIFFIFTTDITSYILTNIPF